MLVHGFVLEGLRGAMWQPLNRTEEIRITTTSYLGRHKILMQQRRDGILCYVSYHKLIVPGVLFSTFQYDKLTSMNNVKVDADRRERKRRVCAARQILSNIEEEEDICIWCG